MEIALGFGLIMGVLIFGFGYGLISTNPKYFPVYYSLWILFILGLMGTLMLFLLEVIHGLLFAELWLGFLFLALLWVAFAWFGRYVSKEKQNGKIYQRNDALLQVKEINDAKTQQRNDAAPERQDNQEEKE